VAMTRENLPMYCLISQMPLPPNPIRCTVTSYEEAKFQKSTSRIANGSVQQGLYGGFETYNL